MATLEELSRRIDTTKDLQSIVRTMKALSAVSIRQYEAAADALADYWRTVELGLRVALGTAGGERDAGRDQDGGIGAIVFGSDHGLCGRFNEEIADFTRSGLQRLAEPGEAQRPRLLVVGLRAASRLESLGLAIEDGSLLPGSAQGLRGTAQELLLRLEEWRERGTSRVYLFHNRRSQEAMFRSERQRLLPIDSGLLHRVAEQPWPSRRLPTFTMSQHALFASLVRQYLFVSIYRAGAESMASEHATRLAAMQAAERNIEDHLEEMNSAYRRERQDSITEELLDVVAGFETLRSGSGRMAV